MCYFMAFSLYTFAIYLLTSIIYLPNTLTYLPTSSKITMRIENALVGLYQESLKEDEGIVVSRR